MNGQMAGGGRGEGAAVACSTVKIFDIYTEEGEYIQATKGEEDHLSLVRGTFGTANARPNPCVLSVSVLFLKKNSVSLQSRKSIEILTSVTMSPLLMRFIHVILGGLKWQTSNAEVWGRRRSFPATVLLIRQEPGRSSPPHVAPCFYQQESLVQKAHVCASLHKNPPVSFSFLK